MRIRNALCVVACATTKFADVENPKLVERRLAAMQALLTDAWAELACCYELVVEPEIYWRLGGPPDVPDEAGRVDR